MGGIRFNMYLCMFLLKTKNKDEEKEDKAASDISSVKVKSLLTVSGKSIDTRYEKLYKFLSDPKYVTSLRENWDNFYKQFTKLINEIETTNVKQDESKEKENENKNKNETEKAKDDDRKKHTFPLLVAINTYNVRIEKLIQNEINSANNFDRFLHILVTRIFKKSNNLATNGLITFMFEHLKTQFPQGLGEYDFQKRKSKDLENNWLYFWHSILRRTLEHSTKISRIDESNGFTLMKSTLDEYIAATKLFSNPARIKRVLSILKTSDAKKNPALSKLQLANYCMNVIKHRRLGKKKQEKREMMSRILDKETTVAEIVDPSKVISLETARNVFNYYLSMPDKILTATTDDKNSSDKSGSDKQWKELNAQEYDTWRNEVYSIYNNLLQNLSHHRDSLLETRQNTKTFENMHKIDQQVLEEDIKEFKTYVEIVFEKWSVHLTTHMFSFFYLFFYLF